MRTSNEMGAYEPLPLGMVVINGNDPEHYLQMALSEQPGPLRAQSSRMSTTTYGEDACRLEPLPLDAMRRYIGAQSFTDIGGNEGF